MEQKNEIRVDQIGGVTLLDIRGDVTADSERPLTEAYENASKRGTNRILLRFDEDAYINSGGIAILIQLLGETKRNNQRIGITGISDHFKKIFQMTGITKFAKIYDSMEEALKSMSKEV